MTSIETELQENYSRLSSDKITERRKSVTELKDLLERDAVIQTLNAISKRKTESDASRSWNSFFIASHNALLKEIQRFEGKAESKSSSVRDTNKRLFMSVMSTVVKCGTEVDPFIKCGSIIDAVIYVLQSPYYRQEIGSVYVNILYERVLSIPRYWNAVKLENWKSLFELFVKIFDENTIPHSKKSTIVAILNSIIKYGSAHSSLLIEIKHKIFHFLKKVLQITLRESADFQLQSLKLVLTCCEKLKKECRIAICKFTEEIFDRLLDMGHALIHDEKKQFLTDILLLSVECHHPNGVMQQSDMGAYAHDWDDWNRKLKQLNYVVNTELDNKPKYKKLQVLPTNFVKLAGEVQNQIFRSGSNYIEVTNYSTLNESISSSERGSSSKRRRILCGFADIIERLRMELEPIYMWPWLSVINSLISRYPNIVNDCDYMLLLQSMDQFLSASKEETVTDYLCQCCIALIDVRRNGHLHTDQGEEEEAAWDSIWNLVLRTIGLNQNIEWSHKLLQRMMQYKWRPTMGMSVLKLFLSQGVRLSSASIVTLRQLRSRFSFPHTILDIPVHSTLLTWLLPVISVYSSVEYFLKNLELEKYAHVIVLACLRSNLKRGAPDLAPLEFSITWRSNIPADEIHKLSSYSCDIFDAKDDEEEADVSNEGSAGCVLNDDAFGKLINILKDHHQSLLTLEVCRHTIDAITDGQSLNVDDAMTTVQYLNTFGLFLIHIQRFMEFYAVNASVFRLRTIHEEVLQESKNINEHLLRMGLNVEKQTNVFLNMSFFFKHLNSFPAHLLGNVVEDFFPSLELAARFLEYELPGNSTNREKCSTTDNEDISLFEMKNLSERERLLVESWKILVYFSFNRGPLHDRQFQVLETISKILIDTFKQTNDVNPAFLIMSVFTVQTVFTLESLSRAELEVDLFTHAIELIKVLYSAVDNNCCTTEESALIVLKLIQQAVSTSHLLSDRSKWEELAKLIYDIKEKLSDCSPRVSLEIARCLFLFPIKCTPRLNAMSDHHVNILLATSSSLLEYLKQPFHEVQVTVLGWLPSIFVLLDLITVNAVKEIMNDFSTSLFEMFDVEDSNDDKMDENVNRPLIVFYAIASAMCNSKTRRRQQIFTFFCIIHEKRLNFGLAFKMLNLVGRHLKKEVNDLIRDNLEFVLFSWFTKYNCFENFPFQALGHNSMKDFYHEYMNEVVTVLYCNKPKLLEEVSKTLEISVLDIVKKCFPEVMAILCQKFAEARHLNRSSETATKYKQFVENTLTNEIIETTTINHLADLLISILRHLHDPEFQITKPYILPLPTPLKSNQRLVEKTIKYLQEMMGTNSELIVYVAEQYPVFIQKIFQKLYVNVLNASTPEVRLESLQRYLLYCELLIPHHAVMSDLRLSAFITRTIVKNLLCFLSADPLNSTFLKSTLKYFLRFMSEWLSNDERYVDTGRVFSECLSSIVNALVITVSRNNDFAQDSLDIIRYLLSGRYDVLRESISNLEPFPDRAPFHEFQFVGFEMMETLTDEASLRNGIKSFLESIENSVYSPRRVESLKHLRKQLSSHEFELVDIFESCAFHESPENSDRSMAHRLIIALIQHTKCEDDEVKYEAVRCLCEIGLVDLHTLVLKQGCDSTAKTGCQSELLIENICTILTDCIVDNDIDVVNAACRLLSSTVYSLEGFKVVTNKISPLQKSFIYPFIPSSPNNVAKKSLWQFFSVMTFKEQVDSELLWFPVDDTSYTKWIKNLVAAISESFNKECFLNSLHTVSKLKVSIAESVFKYLVNLLSACDVQEPAEIFGRRVNQFFECYFSLSAQENLPDSLCSNVSCTKNGSIYNEKSSIQILLDVADFVRLNQPADTNGLNLNYLYVAKAALHCNAYFTCILFAELHLNSLIQKYDVPYNGNILSYLEDVGNKSTENQKDLLDILREAFSKIGDTDALYGCGSSSLLDSEMRIVHYQQIGSWQRVIESCDTILASNPLLTSRMNDLTKALGYAGFNHLQKQFLSTSDQFNSRDAQYECAWKLAQWDIEEPCDDEKTFSYYQFAALKDIHQHNHESVRLNLEHARKSLVHKIAHVGLESTKNVYRVLAKLQCLQDIENLICATDVNDVIRQWKRKDSLTAGLNFDHKQTIFNQRVRMVDTDVEEVRDFVLNIAKKARREDQFNLADTCLSLIKDKAQPSTLSEMRVRLEEARVLYHRNETYVARYLLKDLLKKEEVNEHEIFHAISLRTYGKWLAEMNLENADTILENYFEPAAQLVREMPSETAEQRKVRVKIYKQLGEFADLQYQQISEYIKSDEFKEQVKNVRVSKVSAAALEAGNNKDLQKSKVMLSNQSKIEESQVKDMQRKEERYLMLALKFYLKMLAECNDEDMKVFRVISFWLDQKTNDELHKELEEGISKIPSHKFIPVLPQLMAHLTCNTSEIFGKLLNGLLDKCARDHPHHTLPVIFSIKNYTEDDKYDSNAVANTNKNEDRVKAASNLIEQIRAERSLRKIISEMEQINEAYIQFAYFSDYYKTSQNIPISSRLRILKIKNFEHTFCPTFTVPINRSGCYKDVVGIRHIGKSFLLLGGINAPKKIDCVCTDGQTRLQMVKGQDDLRSDAVMQQVFLIMNKLLNDNKQTSKRRLLLRTYKIVPLSQRSGVFEFCTNTVPLGKYLAYLGSSNPGAHHRFRPQDIKTTEARAKCEKIRKTPFSTENMRLKVFDEVCQVFKPVFRYFFIERFPSSTVWFERKLAYIQSVATTSMVGYILGIGDRHVQNILIDQATAEVIHIDFGIAFDQGLNLNVPERIPFRLTRDIEDGMGIFSIEGIFRRCCEQVMVVLRENSEIIRTTSEVFLHDPLYQWTLTTEKRASVQKGTKGSEMSPKSPDLISSRALSKLKLKLKGIEDGIPTNVEGQVNRLIQQARDRRNLALVFEGWQPYL